MTDDLKLACKALNVALNELALVKEFKTLKERVFKKSWVKEVTTNKELHPKLNDISKAAMQYEKMKSLGQIDIDFENMLSLWEDVIQELEEVKREIVL